MLGIRRKSLLCALLLLDIAHALSRVRQVCSAVDVPHPQKDHCNYRGHLKEPIESYAAYYAESFDGCRDRCITDERCDTFGFVDKSGYCPVYDVSIAYQRPGKGPGDGFAYWSRDCFRANYTSHPALLNGHFENGDFGGWVLFNPSQGMGSAAVKRSGHKRSFAARLSTAMDKRDPGQEPNTVTLKQSFDLCGGTTYDFYGTYYVEAPAIQPPTNGYHESTFGIHVERSGAETFILSHTNSPYRDGTPMNRWLDLPSAHFTPKEDGEYVLTVNVTTAHPASPLSIRFDRFEVMPAPRR